MARFLGTGSVLKSPRTTRAYTVAEAAQWEGSGRNLRPPAHIIGVGGFGVTYRVVDERGQPFCMKEYFPRDHAQRGADGRIVPKRTEDGFSRKIFDEGLRRFVAEGTLLTSFVHPSVQRVVDAFDDNGTSYQLMKLVEGREALGESDTGAARVERRVTLEDFLQELERDGQPIDLALIEPVLRQLLNAVEYIHTEGTRKAQEITGAPVRALLHRDIKPQNVLIEAPEGMKEAPAAEILRDPRTVALLIDFGSARLFRDVGADDVSRSIGVVTEGYAPPELKDNDVDQQGPHSDIYSVAAVIWRAFVGRKPTTAQLANGAKLADLALPIRGEDGALRPRAPKAFLNAVDRALNAAVGQRPQSIAEWRAELWGAKPPKPAKTRASGTRAGETSSPRRGMGGALWLLGAAAAAVIVALVWFNSGGPARNIQKQADLAYQDVQKAAALAGDLSTRAEQAAKDAQALVDPAIAKANDGHDRYQRFLDFQPDQKIYHDKDSGDPAYGDKYRHIVLSTGAEVNWWCHKKGADITPDADYNTYTFPGFIIDGESGWACQVGHTHLVHRDFTEERNPWHTAGDGYYYNGEVDAAAQKASGLGQILLGPNALSGRFTPKGSDYEVLGLWATGGSSMRKGLFQLTMSSPPSADDLLGEEFENGNVTFRGHTAKTLKIGDFTYADGDMLGVQNDHGLAIGKATKSDGSTLYGSSGGGPGQVWGRIENAEGVYSGEMVAGKPDGCGIWTRNGRREVGFYVAGAKREGPLPDACRRDRYESPLDISALVQSNAAGASK